VSHWVGMTVARDFAFVCVCCYLCVVSRPAYCAEFLPARSRALIMCLLEVSTVLYGLIM